MMVLIDFVTGNLASASHWILSEFIIVSLDIYCSWLFNFLWDRVPFSLNSQAEEIVPDTGSGVLYFQVQRVISHSCHSVVVDLSKPCCRVDITVLDSLKTWFREREKTISELLTVKCYLKTGFWSEILKNYTKDFFKPCLVSEAVDLAFNFYYNMSYTVHEKLQNSGTLPLTY